MSPEQAQGSEGPLFRFQPSPTVPRTSSLEFATEEGRIVWAFSEDSPDQLVMMVEDRQRHSVWVTLGLDHVSALEAVLDHLRTLTPSQTCAKPELPSSP